MRSRTARRDAPRKHAKTTKLTKVGLMRIVDLWMASLPKARAASSETARAFHERI
jgi:hypothetical protein